MINELLQELRERMNRSVEALQDDLMGIRTGRASPALVEKLPVEYYGTLTPLNQMASIAAPEPRLLVPDKALGSDQTQQILFVVGPDGVVERRVVTTGPLDDGWRVIRSGLDGDEQVVVEGLLSARPGTRVSPRPLETSR